MIEKIKPGVFIALKKKYVYVAKDNKIFYAKIINVDWKQSTIFAQNDQTGLLVLNVHKYNKTWSWNKEYLRRKN